MTAVSIPIPKKYDFTNQTIVNINHKRNRIVTAKVYVNEAEIICNIINVDNNNIQVVLKPSASGYILVG